MEINVNKTLYYKPHAGRIEKFDPKGYQELPWVDFDRMLQNYLPWLSHNFNKLWQAVDRLERRVYYEQAVDPVINSKDTLDFDSTSPDGDESGVGAGGGH